MESTLSELAKLDAEVATYNIPQEVLDDMEKMVKSEQVLQDYIQKDQLVEMAGEEPD